MKKLTKFLSIMLLASMACGTMLSDVQFGQKFTSIDDVKAAGFIRVDDYLDGLGIQYISPIAVSAAVGRAAILTYGTTLGPVMAVLTPDLSSYVTAGNVKTPAIQVFNPTLNNWAQIISRNPFGVKGFVRDNFYIHPTVTFPEIIKPFQK